MKKIIITSLISLMIASSVSSDTDGKVEDCFEGLNRATFS